MPSRSLGILFRSELSMTSTALASRALRSRTVEIPLQTSLKRTRLKGKGDNLKPIKLQPRQVQRQTVNDDENKKTVALKRPLSSEAATETVVPVQNISLERRPSPEPATESVQPVHKMSRKRSRSPEPATETVKRRRVATAIQQCVETKEPTRLSAITNAITRLTSIFEDSISVWLNPQSGLLEESGTGQEVPKVQWNDWQAAMYRGQTIEFS